MDIITFIMGFKFRNEFWVLILPAGMMVADYISGTVYAWGSCTFQSSKMRAGLAKKVGELMILILGELLSYGLNIPSWLMSFISMYIIFMETMSIFENMKKMGVPIPGFISRALKTVDLALKDEEVVEAMKKMAELEKEIDALKRIEKKEEKKE